MKVDAKYLDYNSLPSKKKKAKAGAKLPPWWESAAYGTFVDPDDPKKRKSPYMPANTFATSGTEDADIQKLDQYEDISADQQQLMNERYMSGQGNQQQGPKPMNKYQGNTFGGVSLAPMIGGTLGLINRLLPDEQERRPLAPQMAYNPYAYGTGSQAISKNGGYVTAKDGNWIQKAINPAHKGYCTPMSKKTCTPRRKALAKRFKSGDLSHEHGGVIPDPMSVFNPHEYEHGGNVNGGAKIQEVGANYPNADLMEQWLLYANGGNVNGGAKIKEVSANYPNADLMEQWLLYNNGGTVGASKSRNVGPNYPNTDLIEQWIPWMTGDYKAGGSLPSAAMGDAVNGDPEPPKKRTPQDAYYEANARLAHYKEKLNSKLKAKNPKAFQDYFSQLAPIRKTGNMAAANKYVQEAPYNEYLSPEEVRTTLGDKEYDSYLGAIRSLNQYNVSQGKEPLYGNVEGENDVANLNYGRRFASLTVTPSLDITNTTTGKKYGRQYQYNPQTGSVDFTESGDPSLRPDYISPAQNRPAPTLRFKHGGVMYNDGGEINTMWGGNADLESYNPYDGGTVAFNGDSHNNGGIGMMYNGSGVEVEGGEYASKDADGTLNIYGNMNLPGTKTKFKTLAGKMAKQEKRYDFLQSRGAELVNNTNPSNTYDMMTFNSGKVMMEGGSLGMKDIANKKQTMSALQRAMLDTADKYGLDPEHMSKGHIKKAKTGGKARGGASLPFLENGGEGDPTMADRNNNPGNIKWGKFAKARGAKKGPPSEDGGFFAIFPSKDQGLKAMKDLLKTDTYKNLDVDSAIRKWTGGHPYRYDLSSMKGKKVGSLDDKEFETLVNTMRTGEGTNYGIRSSTPQKVQTPQTPQVKAPPTITPYGLPRTTLQPEPGPKPVGAEPPPLDEIQVPQRPAMPSNTKGLGFNQLLGEMYAFATNIPEAVPHQRYDPQLYTPFQMSFQDRLNENQRTFSAMNKALSPTNPEALSHLASQKYAANNSVLADEFRTNQAIANDVTNKNVSILNDAQLKNIALADTQGQRQSMARSKTRELNQMIFNSVSDKFSKNNLNNQRLAAYENLYDYRFVPTEDGGLKSTYYGPNAAFNFNNSSQGGSNRDVRTISRYDQQGNLKGYAEYDDYDTREEQRKLQLIEQRRKMPLMQVPKLD
jgi:hypothetical protein